MNVPNIAELNLNDSTVWGITIHSGEICFEVDYKVVACF